MKITGLHHAQITIPKGAEEQGREFYSNLGITALRGDWNRYRRTNRYNSPKLLDRTAKSEYTFL